MGVTRRVCGGDSPNLSYAFLDTINGRDCNPDWVGVTDKIKSPKSKRS